MTLQHVENVTSELWSKQLLEMRSRYAAVGVATLPCSERTKAAFQSHWQLTPSSVLWQEAEKRGPWHGNIAIRLGDGLCALDLDDNSAEIALGNYLSTRGVSHQIRVRTPHGMHIYVRVHGAPPWFSSAKWRSDIGQGELRVARTICVCPPSVFKGHTYRFEPGSPEDFPALSTVAWTDLATLVEPASLTEPPEITCLPIPLLRREMPERVKTILTQLKDAPEKASIGRFQSRSEAEGSCIGSLIMAGYELDDVRKVFEDEQPAHWRDNAKQDSYLLKTWRSCLNAICGSSVRQQLAQMHAQAGHMGWPGRSGHFDLAVYRALLVVAWQAGYFGFDASVRDLGMIAAVDKITVSHAINRLIRARRVERVVKGNRDHASRYMLSVWGEETSAQNADVDSSAPLRRQSISSDHDLGGTESMCASPVQNRDPVLCVQSTHTSPELWAAARLGKACGVIYELLNNDPQTTIELAKVTGKNRTTVQRALNTLRYYGLADMFGVSGRSYTFVRGKTDPVDVACVFDCDAAAQKRRKHVMDDRKAQKKRLEEYDRTELALGHLVWYRPPIHTTAGL